MSLINEALKKAQKQRQAEDDAKAGKVTAPGGGRSASPPAKPPTPPPAAPPSASPSPDPDNQSGGGTRQDPQIYVKRHGAAGKRGAPVGLIAGGVAVAALVIWWLVPGGDSASGDAGPIAAQPVEQVEDTASGEAAPSPITTADVGSPAATPPTDVEAAIAAVTGTEGTSEISPEPDQVAENRNVSFGEAVVSAPEPEPAVEFTPAPEPQPQPRSPIEPAPAAQPAPATSTASNVAAPSAPPAQRPQPAAPSGAVTILSDAEATRSAAAVSPGTSAGTSVVPSEAILTYLERSRITGVRASATDPKVLMNDRVYRLNDVVDRDLQLRIIGIAPRELRFRDARGYVYTKTF